MPRVESNCDCLDCCCDFLESGNKPARWNENPRLALWHCVGSLIALVDELDTQVAAQHAGSGRGPIDSELAPRIERLANVLTVPLPVEGPFNSVVLKMLLERLAAELANRMPQLLDWLFEVIFPPTPPTPIGD